MPSIIEYDLLQKLSRNRLNYQEQQSQLDGLKSRLRTVLDELPELSKRNPDIKNFERLKKKLTVSLPKTPKGKKTYKDSITENTKWEETISHRTYIPQGFLGIASVDAMQGRDIAFLATHGLGPCVGYVLYSKSKNICVLAHIDDEFSVTDKKPSTKETQDQATSYYQGFTRKILDEIGGAPASDWQVILVPSQNSQSDALARLLSTSAAAAGILAEIKEHNEEPTSVYLNPEQLPQIGTYDEIIPFESLLPDTLALREALNFPDSGVRLYHMERTELVLQNLDDWYVYSNAQVQSKPGSVSIRRSAQPLGVENQDNTHRSTPTNGTPQESSAAYLCRSFRGCCQSIRNCFRSGREDEERRSLGNNSDDKDSSKPSKHL